MTDTERTAGGDADIELEVPLRSERAKTVRVVAASLAADAGFTIDDIDDLRLAISEIFSILIDDSTGARARIRFSVGDGEIRASIEQVGADDAIELDELASNILATVVDEFAVDGPAVRLVKRADSGTVAD